jgi:hypothetical protein
VNLKAKSATAANCIASSQTNCVVLGSVTLRLFGRNWEDLFVVLACGKTAVFRLDIQKQASN